MGTSWTPIFREGASTGMSCSLLLTAALLVVSSSTPTASMAAPRQQPDIATVVAGGGGGGGGSPAAETSDSDPNAPPSPRDDKLMDKMAAALMSSGSSPGGSTKRTVRAALGTEVRLACVDDERAAKEPSLMVAGSAGVRLWQFPSGETWRSGSGGGLLSRYKVDERNFTLTIARVTLLDSGLYTCFVHGSGGSKKKEPYLGAILLTVFDDSVAEIPPWERAQDYKTNTIRGLIAAVSTAIGFTLCCLVHKYRWKDPAKKAEKGLAKSHHHHHHQSSSQKSSSRSSGSGGGHLPAASAGAGGGYDNPAMRLSTEDVSKL